MVTSYQTVKYYVKPEVSHYNLTYKKILILTFVCHANPARTIMTKYKIFIGKCLSIDALASSAIMVDNITTCVRAKQNIFTTVLLISRGLLWRNKNNNNNGL